MLQLHPTQEALPMSQLEFTNTNEPAEWEAASKLMPSWLVDKVKKDQAEFANSQNELFNAIDVLKVLTIHCFQIVQVTMQSLQKNDKEINLVKVWLNSSIKPTQNDLSYSGVMTKSLWEIQDDIFCLPL